MSPSTMIAAAAPTALMGRAASSRAALRGDGLARRVPGRHPAGLAPSRRMRPRVCTASMAADGAGDMDDETLAWNASVQPALMQRMRDLLRTEARQVTRELYESGAFSNAPPLPDEDDILSTRDEESEHLMIGDWHEEQWKLLDEKVNGRASEREFGANKNDWLDG